VQSIRGEAYYQAGRRDDAIAAWQHSLQLAPNQAVQESLEKAQREAAVEEHFTEFARGHFVLRYENGTPAAGLTDELLRALERDYDGLAVDLGVLPKNTITVVLYSGRQFSDVTQAPDWVGALNDGKLRIPVGEALRITPGLESVLKHELTHSFVHGALPNCPTWLNEGLAQMEEPKSLEALRAAVEPALGAGGWVPMAQLEGSFQKMNRQEAQRAYLESLAAAEYLRSAYGMEGVRLLLAQLADGEKPEAALQTVTSRGYDDLDREVEAYLAKHSHAQAAE
jgi:tetratricopeptide (TPR) repeat protein